MMHNTSGNTAVEVIVSVGILMIFMSGAVVLSLRAQGAYMRDEEVLQAQMYLEQGIEAVRGVKNDTFSSLASGSHGLQKTNGYWEFSGTSDSFGKYTRTVTLSDLSRNSGCAIVSAGGASDSLSKKAVVLVSWNGSDGKLNTLSQTHYLTDWTNQTGCGSASYFTVSTSGATTTSGGKKIEGITIENSTSSSLVLDTIQAWWTNSRLIKKVRIGGDWVWRDNNEGTPDGAQPSGTMLDIVNYTLPANSGQIEIDQFEFDGDMRGVTFSMLFIFTDGTGRYAEVAL